VTDSILLEQREHYSARACRDAVANLAYTTHAPSPKRYLEVLFRVFDYKRDPMLQISTAGDVDPPHPHNLFIRGAPVWIALPADGTDTQILSPAFVQLTALKDTSFWPLYDSVLDAFIHNPSATLPDAIMDQSVSDRGATFFAWFCNQAEQFGPEPTVKDVETPPTATKALRRHSWSRGLLPTREGRQATGAAHDSVEGWMVPGQGTAGGFLVTKAGAIALGEMLNITTETYQSLTPLLFQSLFEASADWWRRLT